MQPPDKYSIFVSNRSKEVILGTLFSSKNGENSVCVRKIYLNNCIARLYNSHIPVDLVSSWLLGFENYLNNRVALLHIYSLYSYMYSLYSYMYSLYSYMFSLYSNMYSLYSYMYSLYSYMYSLYFYMYSLYSLYFLLLREYIRVLESILRVFICAHFCAICSYG